MKGYLIFTDGLELLLPGAIKWRTCHGGEGCDCFEFQCPMPEIAHNRLDTAFRFRGEQGGETVFFGVVDEIDVLLDAGGFTLEIEGRGMGALLLDNQPGPFSFSVAGLEDILSACVYPYGVEVESRDKMPTLRNYTVAASASCWGMLTGFTRRSAGFTPGFSREGKLILSTGGVQKKAVKISGQISALLTLRRYGVISAMYITDEQRVIYNADALNMGISRRKAQPTGELAGFNIAEKGREYFTVTVTVPGAFIAFPGDTVALECPGAGLSGSYVVEESENSGSGGGELCRLTLKKEK